MVAPWVSEHPLIKHLIKRLGHIPVHRGDPDVAAAQEQEFEARVLAGESLAIFPEGGLEVTAGLRPFALGAFQLAAKLGVPVIPVALRGTRAAQPVPKLIPNPVPLMAVIGPPMVAEGTDWDSTLKLSNQARAWIAEECGDPISNRRLRRND
jgi:1-acyl-sn-glycerol-3-phosphate acyltransferase